jgi:hypothetical protein
MLETNPKKRFSAQKWLQVSNFVLFW